MEYLWILLVFGAAAGSMAKSKGRNPVLWAILGLILGPFAVLFVALLKPGSEADQDYQ